MHWNTTTAYQLEWTGSHVIQGDGIQGGNRSKIPDFTFLRGTTKSDIKFANDVKSGKLVRMGTWRGPRKKVSKNCGKHEIWEHKIVVFTVTAVQPQH